MIPNRMREIPEPDYRRCRKQGIPLVKIVCTSLALIGIACAATIVYMWASKPEQPPSAPPRNVVEKPNWPLIRELLARPLPLQEANRRAAVDIEKKILDCFPKHGEILPISIKNIFVATESALSANGRIYAFSELHNGDKNRITVWDLEAMKQRHFLNIQQTKMALSPDGETLACAGDDIQFWSMKTGKLTKEIQERLPSIVEFSPDGRNLLAHCTDELRRWDMASGKELSQIPDSNSVEVLAFSPNGSILALAKNNWLVELWDYQTVRKLATIQWRVDLHVRHLAFSPDGKYLAVGGSWGHPLEFQDRQNPYLKLIDLATGQEHDLSSFTSFVGNLSFSPDSNSLAVHQSTQGILFLDVASRKVKKHFQPPVLISHAQFFPGGSLFITVGRLGMGDFGDFTYGMRVWQVSKIFETD